MALQCNAISHWLGAYTDDPCRMQWIRASPFSSLHNCCSSAAISPMAPIKVPFSWQKTSGGQLVLKWWKVSCRGKRTPVWMATYFPGIILCMCPANERGRYSVTPSLIGWAHTQNDPCTSSWWKRSLNPSGTEIRILWETWSILWLLMPRLLALTSHQQTWYWLCRL